MITPESLKMDSNLKSWNKEWDWQKILGKENLNLTSKKYPISGIYQLKTSIFLGIFLLGREPVFFASEPLCEKYLCALCGLCG